MFKCELCENKNYHIQRKLSIRLGIEDLDYHVVQCTKCKLCSLYPLPEIDDLSNIYDDYAEQGNRIEVEMKRIVDVYPKKIALIEKFAPNSKSILDIGAGLGGFAFVAKQRGFQVISIEMQQEQVRLALKIFNIELVNIDIDSFISKSTAKVDVIFLHHVLEHLHHPLAILKSLKSLLNSNGIIMIEVPNQFWHFPKELKLKLRLIEETKSYNLLHHLYFFSPSSFARIIKEAGYEIIYFNEINEKSLRIKKKIFKSIAHCINLGYQTNLEIIGNARFL